MKIQIEATPQQWNRLVVKLHEDSNFDELRQQILDAIAMDTHNQLDEVPKPGDDPIIERSE